MSRPVDRPIVSAFLALSLDGYIAGPNGDLSWLEPYGTDSPTETGYERLLGEIDTLVMGRNTYEKVLTFGFWPYTGKRVIVLTNRPFAPVYGEIAQDGPLSEVLKDLRGCGSRHVYVDGGQVVCQGLASRLVDEITLSWVPVMLGGGIRLFDGMSDQVAWTVQSVRQLPSGIVQAVYRDSSDGMRTSSKEANREAT